MSVIGGLPFSIFNRFRIEINKETNSFIKINFIKVKAILLFLSPYIREQGILTQRRQRLICFASRSGIRSRRIRSVAVTVPPE